MTPHNLKKMLFMFFENSLYDNILKTYKDYEYISKDASCEILNSIAKIWTTTDKSKILNELESIWNSSPTMEFPNPKGIVMVTIGQLIAEGDYNQTDFPERYLSATQENIYYSPNLNVMSINGEKYDKNLELVDTLNRHIGDTVVFRENIEALDDLWYKNYLKLIHSINTSDIEYSKSSQEFFLNFIDKPNSEYLLQPYIILINLLEAEQRIHPESDISEDERFKKLENLLQDNLFALNLEYIKIWTKEKMDVLKGLASIKTHLTKFYDYTEIEHHLDSLLKV